MTNPQPVPITQDLEEKLSQIVTAASRFGDFHPFSKTELERDIKKLQKHNRFESDLLMAKLAHIDGDLDVMLGAFKNAALNRPSEVFRVRRDKTMLFANLLLASDVLSDAMSVCKQKGEVVDFYFPSAVATIGGFQAVTILSKRMREMNAIFSNYPNIHIVGKAAEVLRVHQVSDEQCAQVIDVAGEVMRGRRLLWKNHSPDFYVSPHGDFVKIDYRVDVSAKEAALMSFEMMDMLIERDLAGLPFSVDFLGVAA